MIDLHCHLLPGVDDGASSLDASVEMASKLVELGFEAVCCTPHVPWAKGEATPAELAELRGALRGALARAGVALELHPGGEHRALALLEQRTESQLVAYPRGDTFLMEFSLCGFPPRLDDLLFHLQVKRRVPVLAHVERYPEVQRDIRALEPLQARGCHLLINLTSLAGTWDRAAQVTARSVVQAGLAEAAATDMHAVGEADAVAAGLSELERLVGPEGLERMMRINPANIAGLNVSSGRV